jgi:hypothetical protein
MATYQMVHSPGVTRVILTADDGREINRAIQTLSDGAIPSIEVDRAGHVLATRARRLGLLAPGEVVRCASPAERWSA